MPAPKQIKKQSTVIYSPCICRGFLQTAAEISLPLAQGCPTQHNRAAELLLFIIIIIIIFIYLLSLLCRVFTIVYIKQTMFLGYIVLQLFYINCLSYM